MSSVTKGFQGIFSGISQHQKAYLVYVPSTGKIVHSNDVVFDAGKSSALVYTSRLYSEALAMESTVSSIPYNTSSYEQTYNIINFA